MTTSDDNVIKFTSNDMPPTKSGSILKKVESDFFLRFRNIFLCTVPAHSKADGQLTDRNITILHPVSD